MPGSEPTAVQRLMLFSIETTSPKYRVLVSGDFPCPHSRTCLRLHVIGF